MTKIKEKIGLYKTLIALFWTALIIIGGGTYKVYQTKEMTLFYLALGITTMLFVLFCSLIVRIRYWINKLGDK